MPSFRTSSTQSFCSILIIDTVSWIDAAVFVETSPGDAAWFVCQPGCHAHPTYKTTIIVPMMCPVEHGFSLKGKETGKR
jgi:hypothetical protein